MYLELMIMLNEKQNLTTMPYNFDSKPKFTRIITSKDANSLYISVCVRKSTL